MVVITIVRWGYKPTYNVWGPHIVETSFFTAELRSSGVMFINQMLVESPGVTSYTS
jgi:hypothetical protein